MFYEHQHLNSHLHFAAPNVALLALDSQRQIVLWTEALHSRGWTVLDAKGTDMNQTSRAGFRPSLVICNKRRKSEIQRSLSEPSSHHHGWSNQLLPPDILLVEGLAEGLAENLPTSDLQSILGTRSDTPAVSALIIPTASLLCAEEADYILDRVIQSRDSRYRRLEEEAMRSVYAEASALLVTAGRTAQLRRALRTIQRAAEVKAAAVINRRDDRTIVEATTDLPRRQAARLRAILESMTWSAAQTEQWQATPTSRPNLPETWRHARILPVHEGLFCLLLNDRPSWPLQAARDVALVIDHLCLVIERPDQGWNRHQWLPPDRQPLTGFLSLEGLHIWLSHRKSARHMDILSIDVTNADQVEHRIGVIATGRLARRIAQDMVLVAEEDDVLVQPSALRFSIVRTRPASKPPRQSTETIALLAQQLADKMKGLDLSPLRAAPMLPTDLSRQRHDGAAAFATTCSLDIHITSCSTNAAAMDVMWPATTGDPCAKTRKKSLFKIRTQLRKEGA